MTTKPHGPEREIDMTKPAAEPTWEDVWAAIGREVWKLAPQDHQDSGHRDLTFLTCWQNVMEAVDKGIASCYPDDHASPHCACGINDIGQEHVDPICERARFGASVAPEETT